MCNLLTLFTSPYGAGSETGDGLLGDPTEHGLVSCGIRGFARCTSDNSVQRLNNTRHTLLSISCCEVYSG